MGAKCEHGAAFDDETISPLGWNGPVSRCGCCGCLFGYVDEGSFSLERQWSRTWLPKNRCGQCGGAYVEDEYVAPKEPRDG